MSTDRALSPTHTLSNAKTVHSVEGTNQCLHHMLAIVWQSYGSICKCLSNTNGWSAAKALPVATETWQFHDRPVGLVYWLVEYAGEVAASALPLIDTPSGSGMIGQRFGTGHNKSWSCSIYLNPLVQYHRMSCNKFSRRLQMSNPMAERYHHTCIHKNTLTLHGCLRRV